MSKHIDPLRSQFDEFKDLPRDQPIMMLNLLQFRDRADYGDEREVSGAAAYQAYGEASGPVFRRVGGRIIWRGDPDVVLIGPPGERWDAAFIARYPSVGSFLEMVTDPDYKMAVKHRQAGVRDSRLICTSDAEIGAGFSAEVR